jgi:hypothetical protein
MARPPKPRWKNRTARCENGHEFTVKQEPVGNVVSGEEGGHQVIRWMPGNVEEIVACPVPNCRSTRFELVEE